MQKCFEREGRIASREPSKMHIPGPVYPKYFGPECSAFVGAVVVSGQNTKTWCPQGAGQIRPYFEFRAVPIDSSLKNPPGEAHR